MTDTDSAQHDPSQPAHDPVLVRRIQAAEQRVASLRRTVVWLGVGMSILLGLASAVIYLASQHGMPGLVADVMESRSFILRDAQGDVRGTWEAGADGTVRFVLQNGPKSGGVTLNLLNDGSAGVTLSDPLGNSRLVLGFIPNENVSIVLADPSGVTRAVFGLGAEGAASLVFADHNGATKAAIGVDATGAAVLAAAESQSQTVDSAE